MPKSSRGAIPLGLKKHSGEIPNDRQHRDCALVLGGFFVSGVPMPMIGEIWREVPGFELYYHASNYGRVKTLERWVRNNGGQRLIPERILKMKPGRGGYVRVTLCRGESRRYCLVHRLVLEIFVGPCPPGMEGCHNDGNPSNNHVGNLRWDSSQANADDMVKHGRQTRGERNSMAKLNEAKVREIRARLAKGETQREIAAVCGISQMAVSHINTGKRWRHVTEEA